VRGSRDEVDIKSKGSLFPLLLCSEVRSIELTRRKRAKYTRRWRRRSKI
jgi:hypothetical protein